MAVVVVRLSILERETEKACGRSICRPAATDLVLKPIQMVPCFSPTLCVPQFGARMHDLVSVVEMKGNSFCLMF